MEEDTPRQALRSLAIAAWQTQCLRVAADLGIADRLGAHPSTSAELAEACGVRQAPLSRLLRALAAMGVLEEDAGQRYLLTAVGAELRAGRLGPFASSAGGEPGWSAWAALGHSVRTGECAFEHVYGMPAWEYHAAHAEDGARFRAGMAALTRGVSSSVAASYDFSRFGVVVDVGGGDGTLLAEILRRYPGTRGILADLPHVVDTARAAMDAAGVSDRCALWAGDFRVALPQGDVYLLKSVLHDWQDEDALTVLRSCRKVTVAAPLLIVERVLPEQADRAALEAMLTDLNMMVMVGGLERTTAEFRSLLGQAGFQLDRVLPTGTEFSLIEASIADR